MTTYEIDMVKGLKAVRKAYNEGLLSAQVGVNYCSYLYEHKPYRCAIGWMVPREIAQGMDESMMNGIVNFFEGQNAVTEVQKDLAALQFSHDQVLYRDKQISDFVGMLSELEQKYGVVVCA